jgi:hypothetical protein
MNVQQQLKNAVHAVGTSAAADAKCLGNEVHSVRLTGSLPVPHPVYPVRSLNLCGNYDGYKAPLRPI